MLYLLSKQKPLTATSVSFALMTLILLFARKLHCCAAAESVGTKITSKTIGEEVPATWRCARAGVGTESWSDQENHCVCQTPGHGSQAALMPQTFVFH